MVSTRRAAGRRAGRRDGPPAGRWAGRLARLAMLAAAFCCSPVPQARAVFASEVGIEARGVLPWVVLNNRWKLDVRDESNRPVSARRLERDLKSAAAQAAAQCSFASRLPYAKAVARFLEFFPAAAAFLFDSLPGRPMRAAASAASVPRPPRIMLVALAAALCSMSTFLLREARPEREGSASRLPLVLRC